MMKHSGLAHELNHKTQNNTLLAGGSATAGFFMPFFDHLRILMP